MDLILAPEQEELRAAVRALLDERSPPSEVRRAMATPEGCDRALWSAMAELGLPGMAVPPERGGRGLTFVDVAVVQEEMGRALACVPFFSTAVMAAAAFVHSGGEAEHQELLGGIASGECLATVAIAEDSGGGDPSSIRLTAKPTPGGANYLLDGHATFVVDGELADLVLVPARTPGPGRDGQGSGLTLFEVAGNARGLSRTPLPVLDPTRRLARLEFESTPARPVGAEGQAEPVMALVLDLARVALAAEQVGGAQRCLDMAVAHARSRFQFGRPIGSFQAVKHKCAEMLLDVETARAAAYHAAGAAARLDDELPVAASVAQVASSEAFTRAAAENIQIHGGKGFTWDHDAHLYYRRAKSSRALLGDPAYHRERIAQRTGT